MPGNPAVVMERDVGLLFFSEPQISNILISSFDGDIKKIENDFSFFRRFDSELDAVVNRIKD